MALRFSLNKFPCDVQLRDGAGLPWGCVVQPFAVDEDAAPLSSTPLTLATDVARCDECFAYINAACHIERYSWRCCLCDMENQFRGVQMERYGNRTLLGQCPELSSGLVELDVAGDEGSGVDQDMHTRPVYIAAVDLTGGDEFLELIKSALLAALEALPPAALFGLVTFSHKVGLYDVQGSVPVLKTVTIPPSGEGALPMDLSEVMDLEALLAPVSEYKERIAAALETLRPASDWEQATAGGQLPDGTIGPGSRGFGTAMDALLKFLGAEQGELFVSARLLAFLSGRPDYGAGILDSSRYGAQYATKGEDADKALLPEQTPFYKDLAALAVQAGVCVDLWVISGDYCDLASLKFLSTESGGSLFLYRHMEDNTLPQDIYRLLSRPHAFGGILRLRTSPEFKPVEAYGHFREDGEYDHVHHIIACDQFDCFTFDFDFTSSAGFGRPPESAPVIQLAFQYTVMVPVPDEDGPENTVPSTPGDSTALTPTSGRGTGGRQTKRYVLRRRLRLRTLHLSVARTAVEVMEGAEPEVVLALLTQKAIRASLEEGVKEAGMLVQDWLVILTALYNDQYRIATFGSKDLPSLDISFLRCPPLQPIPRLAFALLRNPLLQLHEEGVHPDYRIYLQCLYTSLEPSCLLRAIYPMLSSYTTPDNLAFPRHSLSQAALVTSNSPIFLLDAFTTLIVFYTASAPKDLPYPPPQNSELRSLVNKLKQECQVTPKLLIIREEDSGTRGVFERFLIEEQDIDTVSKVSAGGFVGFLEQTSEDVREYMQK